MSQPDEPAEPAPISVEDLDELEQHLRWMSHQTAVAGFDLETGVRGALRMAAELRRLRKRLGIDHE